MTENITKTYKIGKENVTEAINSERRDIASNLTIADRVDVMAEKSAFITMKYHKGNFESHHKCCLINPSKSVRGKVSKVVLDNINNAMIMLFLIMRVFVACDN